MYELLRRCVEDDDPESWSELWGLYFDVVDRPVRRLMRQRYCEHDAEDMVMSIAVELLGNRRDKLRSFRGRSRGELCNWFLQVAVRATLKWMDANGRRARRLRESQQQAPGRCPGPTEEEVRLIIMELEQAAQSVVLGVSSRDAERLRILAGLETSDNQPTERTVRHWTQRLLPHVARLISC